jgi:nucleotide-binding universal stress UspA family protein
MRVLLAVDGSEYSEEAEQAVATQIRNKGTEVRVLTVVEPISSYISADMFPHMVSQSVAIAADRVRQARSLVTRVAGKLRKAGFKASETLEEGDPKTVILDQAAAWPADLIVLGSHGLKGLNRFVMGSVSAAVSQHAGCSVEIVRLRPEEKKVSPGKRSAR